MRDVCERAYARGLSQRVPQELQAGLLILITSVKHTVLGQRAIWLWSARLDSLENSQIALSRVRSRMCDLGFRVYVVEAYACRIAHIYAL